MKLNWGTGIVIVILIFVAACAVFLVFASRQDNTLVESDYYSKGIRYEEMINKMRNSASLSSQPSLGTVPGFLTIQYPSELKGQEVRGSVYVYRPSDRKLDVIVPLMPDTAVLQKIPLSRFVRGKYVVKLDWSMNGKSYYFEKEIYIE